MKSNTWLNKQIAWSPLSSQAVLRPKGSSTKRVLISSLVLTSLVDAFSILVIFLLMNTQTGLETIEVSKETTLPMAVKTEALTDGVVLKIEKGAYILGDTEVPLDQLAEALGQAKKLEAEKTGKEEVALVLQADKEIGYNQLSPILEMGAVNGFQQYRLAVLQKSQTAE